VSDDGLGSLDDDDDAGSLDEDADSPDEDADWAPSPPLFAPAEEEAAARVADEPPRSFFAQPEPLKWIVGRTNCLRIVPSRPHDGQKCGPGSLIPWRMSARWSQAVQAYS
jgi:hypothetical protein